MKVSVVIPTLANERTYPYLKLCVESLRATTDWQIIVVTNGTKTMPNLRDIEGISIHKHTSQQGQCQAVNIGTQAIDYATDYIMVSNDDMYYAPGWNNNLRFDDLCFSPNLVEPTNNGGSAAPFQKVDGGLSVEEFNKEVVDAFVAKNKDKKVTTGFNLPFFIRKDVWQTIEGYDTAYDPWGSNSDTDLQTKIELAGIQPMRYRDILVYHFGSKSGTFDGTHQDAWQKNWNYYTRKWGFNRDDEPIPDTWMATDMVNWEKLTFEPNWVGKFSEEEKS